MAKKIEELETGICTLKNETTELLEELFGSGNDFDECTINSKIKDFSEYLKMGNDNISINWHAKDISKKPWKPKSHFTKIFYNEINYAKKQYNITNTEMEFLYSLSGNLKWESNLIIDKNEMGITQIEIANMLNISPRTIRRNMKKLEDKKCIILVTKNKKRWYIVNPYLMFCGKSIPYMLPEMFKKSGYVPLEINKRIKRKVDKKKEENELQPEIS